AAHEEAFLDNLTVPDRVKPDLIEVRAFLALWRDLSLEANDELIAVHIGTLDLEIMHFVVRFPPFAFSFDRLAPLEHRHIAGHRLAAHDFVGHELLTSGLYFALRAHVGESFRQLLGTHMSNPSLAGPLAGNVRTILRRLQARLASSRHSAARLQH